MYWTLQNLKDSEIKQYILHYGSIFSAATVASTSWPLQQQVLQYLPVPKPFLTGSVHKLARLYHSEELTICHNPTFVHHNNSKAT
jgi:hypothetical protein